MAIDTSNDQLVGGLGDEIVVMFLKPKMSKAEALRHAAWLVAMAEEVDGEFDAVLKAVKGT